MNSWYGMVWYGASSIDRASLRCELYQHMHDNARCACGRAWEHYLHTSQSWHKLEQTRVAIGGYMLARCKRHKQASDWRCTYIHIS
jgi:hypothetical protein